MNDFCLTGICRQITCYTVVKTHTYSNQDITFIGFYIRTKITMHAEHSFIQRMLGR